MRRKKWQFALELTCVTLAQFSDTMSEHNPVSDTGLSCKRTSLSSPQAFRHGVISSIVLKRLKLTSRKRSDGQPASDHRPPRLSTALSSKWRTIREGSHTNPSVAFIFVDSLRSSSQFSRSFSLLSNRGIASRRGSERGNRTSFGRPVAH